MLDLSFAKPVKINTKFIDVRKTKRIESNISCHGTVKLNDEKNETQK
jgi:hypothetical protein